MNKIIDITFDLETCDVTPSAAPMQLAAVVWDRYRTEAIGDPFLRNEAPCPPILWRNRPCCSSTDAPT